MRFDSPMIVVSDIERSRRFYAEVLGEEVLHDLGNYVVFKGGFSMMGREAWRKLAGAEHGFELYFEEEDVESFARALGDAPLLTPLSEAPWGQRTVRLLDPDGHAVEVGEPMEAVVRRLVASGMAPEEAARKSLMPIEFVRRCIEK
ncbi:MAG: glyoxalase/bleomycin resistance/dioxygenase family protein [Clostridiales bacterium]|jgi:lactoylglutathione lyase|nr:glyoxalase/bleomycin resistance/dioxygenase family protein [Clostridiales bacterium]